MIASIPRAGTVLAGKYSVVRQLGEGGMGAVFEAEHLVTRKRVAIKWMHPKVASNSDAAKRLVREAQASSMVRHPNVVDVFDVVQEGDTIFLVMELLEGEPLSALLARGNVPLHEVIALLLPAMRGVAAAHAHGVIHRDIKPDNIFLTRLADTPAPVPKVLDFGISKVTSNDLSSMTRTGTTMGTPMYMSFEQLCGEKNIDGRTDIYAFGVILYEASTGQTPFQAESFTELAVKIATSEPPRPKAIRADIPTPLERLILWSMNKQREDRLPTLTQFAQELESFATERAFRSQMTNNDAPILLSWRPGHAGGAGPEQRAVQPQEVQGTVEPTRPTADRDSALEVYPVQRNTLPKVIIVAGIALLVIVLAWLGLAKPENAALPPSGPGPSKLPNNVTAGVGPGAATADQPAAPQGSDRTDNAPVQVVDSQKRDRPKLASETPSAESGEPPNKHELLRANEPANKRNAINLAPSKAPLRNAAKPMPPTAPRAVPTAPIAPKPASTKKSVEDELGF